MKFLRRALLFAVTAGVLAGVIFGRLAWAYRQTSKAEAAPEPSVATELGSTASLSITPLFEEWASSNQFQSGHGVSYLIRTDKATILMDLGNNEQSLAKAPLIHNMEQLAISVEEIDAVVVTHDHPDHVGGVTNWRRGSLGEPLARLAGKTIYKPKLALGPMVIAPGIATLGRQSFVEPLPFRIWKPLGWEQSLVVNVRGMGLVVIMGCGHPSMERIVRRAEAVFSQPVIGVVGGLHYGKAKAEALEPHISFLAERNPRLVALSPHDSSGAVLQAFEAAFPHAYRYITIGRAIELP